jgi:hypothetical protein
MPIYFSPRESTVPGVMLEGRHRSECLIAGLSSELRHRLPSFVVSGVRLALLTRRLVRLSRPGRAMPT